MKSRARWPTIVAGGVVIVAGFAIALVELFRFPKGSVWIVVAVAALLLFVVRLVGRP
jgi:UDP-N-acetylmuramyl pentapeptide phosphotransferase/UDP-N-acetylglucosamine-1-phosphate transferase